MSNATQDVASTILAALARVEQRDKHRLRQADATIIVLGLVATALLAEPTR